MKDKYKDLFDLIDDVCSSKLRIERKSPVSTVLKNVAYFHYCKAINLGKAISILCANGRATEASILLRSLLNVYIDIKWIAHNDSLTRAQRYVDFEIVFRRSHYEAAIAHGTLQKPKNDSKYIQDGMKVDRILKKYNIRSLDKAYNWSGKSIKNMATEIGEEWAYHVLYARASATEHTCPSSVVDYWNGDTLLTSPQEKDIPSVILSTVDYLLLIMLIAAKSLWASYRDFAFFRMRLGDLSTEYLGSVN